MPALRSASPERCGAAPRLGAHRASLSHAAWSWMGEEGLSGIRCGACPTDLVQDRERLGSALRRRARVGEGEEAMRFAGVVEDIGWSESPTLERVMWPSLARRLQRADFCDTHRCWYARPFPTTNAHLKQQRMTSACPYSGADAVQHPALIHPVHLAVPREACQQGVCRPHRQSLWKMTFST